jgi:hypothetical protein
MNVRFRGVTVRKWLVVWYSAGRYSAARKGLTTAGGGAAGGSDRSAVTAGKRSGLLAGAGAAPDETLRDLLMHRFALSFATTSVRRGMLLYLIKIVKYELFLGVIERLQRSYRPVTFPPGPVADRGEQEILGRAPRLPKPLLKLFG